ncbi:MAG: HTH domain-containing protein [Polyangiaceae bacterium]
MRRTERLFALAEALRARKSGITAEALAERFAVTVRTIYRDLDSLRAASLPLNSERGPGGGYALDRSYSLPPVNFTAREAALLVAVGRWVTEMRVLPFGRTIEGALDKVEAALSTPAQRELARLVATLKFVGVPARDAPAAVRQAIESAFFDRRSLRITYRSEKNVVTKRRVQITSVVMERTETLLNCLDLEKNEARQFKLDRIVSAHLEDALLGG